MKTKLQYMVIFALIFAFCSGCTNSEKQKMQITEAVEETKTEAGESEEIFEEEFESGDFDGSEFE